MDFLTGATGTVGAAILRRLVADGRPVRCLVRRPDSLPARPGVEIVVGALDDPQSLAHALDGCTTVFHAAGTPQQWTADPSVFTRNNVAGTRHLLDAAGRAGVARFVHASTQDTLDQTLDPFDEDTRNHDPRPTPYERSKIAAQQLVDAASAQGLHTVSLHLVAVFGPAGPRRRTLNGLIHDIAAGRVPMLPPGGLPVVYDADAADAFIRAAQIARPGSRYLVSDRYLTTRELGQRIAAIARARQPGQMPLALARTIARLGDAFGAVTRRPPMLASVSLRAFTMPGRPSNARLRAELGWQPTDLDIALRATLQAAAGAG